MRLYVQCNHCKRKTYLFGLVAKNRVSFAQQIPTKKIGFLCGRCDTFVICSVNDVYAEESGPIIGLAILTIGLFSTIFIGAIGIFIGGSLGAAADIMWKLKEATRIRKFNTSVIM